MPAHVGPGISSVLGVAEGWLGSGSSVDPGLVVFSSAIHTVRGVALHKHPLHIICKTPSRTMLKQLGLSGGVESNIIKCIGN